MSKKQLTKQEVKKSVRYLAMIILNAVEQEDAYVNLKLSQVLNEHTLSSSDSALLTEIVYGVTQRRLTLDAIIDAHITGRIPLWVRNILRIAAFQLLFLDKVPSYAVLSQATECVRIKASEKMVNFVRGVIRTIEREGYQQLEKINQLADTPKNMSVKYSAPVWLINYFVKHRGINVAKAMFSSLLNKPVISVRTNGKSLVMDAIKEQFTIQPSQLVPKFGLRVLSGQIAKSHWFKNGQITIQDETSMLVALAGQLKVDDVVLDACAAPGGKTTHIASFLENGYVVALDVHEHKLALIRENALRLKVNKRVHERLLDARNVSQTFEPEMFDKVFVDAPCSGLGLMRRKPDIKYTKLLDGVNDLAEIQLSILESVDKTLKSGGLLIYSTCTLTMRENQETIKSFLNTHKNYKILPLDYLDLPKECYTKEGYIEIFPHYFNTDGFFIVVLQKL